MDENTGSAQDPYRPGSADQPGTQAPTPGYPPPAGPRHHGTDGFFDAVRRTGLFRTDDRWIGGVAGGLAVRLRVDPLVTRGILGVSVLLGGLGLVLYGLGWLLLPEQRDGRIHLQQLFRGDFDAAVLGGFAVLLAGLSFPDRWWGTGWGWGWGGDWGWFPKLLWLGAITVVVILIVSSANNRRAQGPHAGPTTTAYPAPPSSSRPAYQAPTYPAPTYQAPSYPAGTYAGPTSAAPTYRDGPTGSSTPPGAQPDAPEAAATRPSEGPTTMYPTSAPPAPAAPVPPVPPPGYAAGPVGGYAPPRGPVGPTTTLPRSHRGPGAGTVGVAVAVSLLALAGLLYAQRIDVFDGPVLLTAGAIAVTVLGIAVIVSGLRGRSSGGLSALAVILTLVVLPAVAVDRTGFDGTWNDGTAFGDVVHTPTDVASAEEGYSLAAGEARIDLTQVPLEGDVVTVPIHVGAGDLTVVVPAGTALVGEIDVMAGEVRWLDQQVVSGVPGTDGTQRFESDEVTGGAIPEIELDIRVGAGTVRVEEAGR